MSLKRTLAESGILDDSDNENDNRSKKVRVTGPPNYDEKESLASDANSHNDMPPTNNSDESVTPAENQNGETTPPVKKEEITSNNNDNNNNNSNNNTTITTITTTTTNIATASTDNKDNDDNKQHSTENEIGYASSSSTTNNYTSGRLFDVRLLLDSKKVGGLIGKSGTTISTIRKESGAKILIAKPVPNSLYRIGSVEGRYGAITRALQMICDTLTKEALLMNKNSRELPSNNTNQTINNSGGVKAPIKMERENREVTSNGATGSNSGNGSHGITLLIEEKNIGCLIGKGGEAISNIRKVTGANIYISPQVLRHSTEKTVDITGSREATHAAIEYVVQRLAENNSLMPTRMPYDPTSDIPSFYDGRKHDSWSSDISEESLFRYGVPTNQPLYRPRQTGIQAQTGLSAQAVASSALASSQQMLSAINSMSTGYANYYYPMSYVPTHGYGNNSEYGQLHSHSYNRQPRGYGHSSSSSRDSYGHSHHDNNHYNSGAYDGYGEDKQRHSQDNSGAADNSRIDQRDSVNPSITNHGQSVVIPVSTKMIGSVIGRQGRNIQDIRIKSQATIQIDNVSTRDERHITVSGTPQQMSTAICLIQEAIKNERIRS